MSQTQDFIFFKLIFKINPTHSLHMHCESYSISISIWTSIVKKELMVLLI